MSLLNKLKSKSLDYGKLVNIAFDKAVKKTGAVVESDVAQKIKTQTIAAQKAGIAWDKIDPELKTALLAGGAAGIGVNVIPLVGQAMAIPTFIGATAYVYVMGKLSKLKQKN